MAVIVLDEYISAVSGLGMMIVVASAFAAAILTQSAAETAGKRQGRLKRQAEASSYRNRVFRRPSSLKAKRRTIARLIFHLFSDGLYTSEASETLETGIHT